jgi:hypothetical protein
LGIVQHRKRFISRLNELLFVVMRDRGCTERDCPNEESLRPPEELTLALPRMKFGLDVVVAVGERHFAREEALRAIGRDLTANGCPIHQTAVGKLARQFLALASLVNGDNEEVRAALRAQGGLVLLVDGVQFDERSPVLYVAWDAISGAPLFGERREFRSAEDLRPVLERVKAMDVPVIGVTTDKEKGLVPAVEAVFPGVPHQFCHTHFLKNCAKPLAADLAALGASVERRAEAVRKIAKRLHEVESPKTRTRARQPRAVPSLADAPPPSAAVDVTPQPRPSAPLTEPDRVRELCAIVRQNARASGKAPLKPPELERHQRLERVREAVDEAREKGGSRRHR